MPDPIDDKVVSESESRHRLKSARLRVGSSASELACHLDNSISAYYDLENCENELYTNISLGHLASLCHALRICSRSLFARTEEDVSAIPKESIQQKLKAYLDVTGITPERFESQVGYLIGPFLSNSSAMLDWNIDGLRAICGALGIDWINALPRGTPT